MKTSKTAICLVRLTGIQTVQEKWKVIRFASSVHTPGVTANTSEAEPPLVLAKLSNLEVENKDLAEDHLETSIFRQQTVAPARAPQIRSDKH